MNNSLIEKKIIEKLQELEESQQLQVLDFANFLVNKQPLGVSGKNLIRFAGSISKEDLELMSYEIEEECRKVDLDEW